MYMLETWVLHCYVFLLSHRNKDLLVACPSKKASLFPPVFTPNQFHLLGCIEWSAGLGGSSQAPRRKQLSQAAVQKKDVLVVSDPVETLLCCRFLMCFGKQCCNTPFQMKITLTVKFKFLSICPLYITFSVWAWETCFSANHLSWSNTILVPKISHFPWPWL